MSRIQKALIAIMLFAFEVYMGEKVFAYDSKFEYGSNTPLAISVNKTECVNGNIVLSFDIVPTIKSIRLFEKSKSLIQ